MANSELACKTTIDLSIFKLKGFDAVELRYHKKNISLSEVFFTIPLILIDFRLYPGPLL